MDLLKRAVFYLSIVVVIAACRMPTSKEPGIGEPISWDELPGWSNGDPTPAWQAFQSQCPRMSKRELSWIALCDQITAMPNADAARVREFLLSHFVPHRVHGARGKRDGLFTGYYEPLLNGSLEKTEKYAYPIYSRPQDLLTIELADVYPSLKGMRLRGRLVGDRVIPFEPRAEIDGEAQPLQGEELVWIDDPYGSFFLQIQGSGRVKLEDGSVLGLDYADQNGQPYYAIGKKLIEWNELAVEDVSLFTIKRWLHDNPQRAQSVVNSNPSYVFFSLREDNGSGPIGSLNVPLTAGRSVAVDRNIIPLGSPVWVDTTLPDGSYYQRLMLAQDTGGAISGAVRADVFFGSDASAEQLAGEMKQTGQLYVLLPKE